MTRVRSPCAASGSSSGAAWRRGTSSILEPEVVENVVQGSPTTSPRTWAHVLPVRQRRGLETEGPEMVCPCTPHHADIARGRATATCALRVSRVRGLLRPRIAERLTKKGREPAPERVPRARPRERPLRRARFLEPCRRPSGASSTRGRGPSSSRRAPARARATPRCWRIFR